MKLNFDTDSFVCTLCKLMKLFSKLYSIMCIYIPWTMLKDVDTS